MNNNNLIVNNFKEIISIPTILNSNFTNIVKNDNDDITTFSISVTVSQTDINNKKNKSYQFESTLIHTSSSSNITTTTITGDKDGKTNIYSSPFPTEIQNSISISPSFKKQIIIKSLSESEYSFDLIDESHLITSIKSKDLHNKILNDDYFGSLQWSHCENYIAYIADFKLKNLDYFEKSDKINNNIGDKYLYKDNLGETYSNIYKPSIFIIDLKKELVYPIDPLNKIIPGQLLWTKDLNLIFIGLEIGKIIYGIRLCFNRKSSIYHLNFNQFLKCKQELLATSGKLPELEIEDLIFKKGSYRSPRLTNDGKHLIFVGFDELIFNHNSCSKIFKLSNWNDKEKRTFEILMDYKYSNDIQGFYGIYCWSFPQKPFIDNETIVFSNLIGSIDKLISFNINSKSIEIYDDIDTLFESSSSSSSSLSLNYTLLKVYGRFALIKVSSINKLPSIYLIKFQKLTNKIQIVKRVFKSSINKNVEDMLSNIQFSIHKVPVENKEDDKIKSFDLIYLKSNCINGGGKQPTLIIIHGGPHMCTTIEYSYTLLYFASLGYNIIIPNYQGSTGYGKNFIDSLIGKIGNLDLNDCKLSLEYTINNIDKQGIDINRIGLIGGSHGGFIAVHLSRDSNTFKTTVLRNPVIDIGSSISDIQDWVMFKCGIKPNNNSIDGNKQQYNSLPTLDELKIMRECSPSNHFNEIQIPILLLLGDKDLRVNGKSQGLLLYRNLQERNIPTKCILYENNGHSLTDTIDSKLDQWINIGYWLNDKL